MRAAMGAMVVAIMVSAAPGSRAQSAVECTFPEPEFPGGRMVITPDAASPGDAVEVSWVPPDGDQAAAMDAAKADPSWSIALEDAPLFAGAPPHTIGGYRWTNLLVPADAVDGVNDLILRRGDVVVWRCPLTIEGGVPPTMTSSTVAPARTPTTNGQPVTANPADGQGGGENAVPGLVVGGAIGVGIGLWWSRRRRRRAPAAQP